MKRKTRKNIKNNKLLVLVVLLVFFSFLAFAFNLTFTEKTTSSIWDGTVAKSFTSGNGTVDDPYIIDDGSELAYFFTLIDNDEDSEYFNKFYRLENNINLNGYSFNFINNAKTFSGTLDGNGYSIFNFVIDKAYIDQDNELNYSLFYSLYSANIRNINLYDVSINTSMPEFGEEEVVPSKLNISLFGKESVNSNITNVSINNVNINNTINDIETKSSFLIIKDIDGNNIQNIFVNGSSNISYTSKLLNHYENANISNIVYKKDDLYLIYDYELVSDSLYPFVIRDNKMSFVNKYPIKSVVEVLNNNSSFEWKYEDNRFRLKNNGTDIVPKIKSAKSANVTVPTAHESGIEGRVVYVNDYQKDIDYYYGINYASSNDNRVPDENDKGIYGINNLVYVNINYHGTDINGDYTGTVSSTELENEFQYYKVYPVNNNGTSDNNSDDFIEFDLIDNPFSNRPTNKTFFGWMTDYEGAVITLDTDIYVRKVKVPITYSGSNPNPISMNVYAIWGNGSIVNYTYSWTNTFNNLESTGFHIITSTVPVFNDDFTTYYIRDTIGFYEQYPSGSVDEEGDSVTGRCYSFMGCTYYVHADANYDDTVTYYRFINGRMTIYVPQIVGYSYQSEVPVGNSIAGYYRLITVPRNASVVGYYNSNGTIMTSGTCNTYGGCSYYELIQYYDENGNPEVVITGNDYYYFTTRDTNVVLVTGTVNGWTTGQNKPFTLTGNGGYLNLNGNNNTTRNIVLGADLRIENIAVNGYTIQDDDTMPGLAGSNTNTTLNRGSIAGAYYNLKIGRGVTQYNNNNTTFTYAIGGTDSGTGSASSLTRYTFIVESGVYNNLGLTTRYVRNANYNIYVHAYGTYGSDYDRVNDNDNSKLNVVYCASGSWTGNIRSTGFTDPALYTVIKSGQFGTNKADYAAGVYVGGRGSGGIYTQRQIIVEGGYIFNLIGGPLSQASNKAYNDTFMYIKGGNIDVVVGGAGASETYGNRIISMTGGTINYALFGGSNGVAGDGDTYKGTLDGDTYIYLGGNAVVGNPTLIQNETLEAVSNVESGSVFGNGNGRSGYTSIGTVNNSLIVIDDGATILKNVYGGGNYGASGQNGTNQTYNTRIVMLGGAVNGSIYGGGNNNGAGSTSNTSNINILVKNGTVSGSIYGGSRTLGRIYGNSEVTLLGGTILSDVYGGGEGGYTNNTNYGTFVNGNVSVNIGDNNNGPTINGNVYGGSAFGTVNAVSTATAANTKTTNVTVNNGTILGKVFGGAKGNDDFTPYVKGNITTTINGGTINEVYGGFDASGKPEGDVVVYLNGGTITNAFGGGNNTSIDETNIYLQGSNVTTLYGGSNQSGTVPVTNVFVTSGTAGTIYGGNNAGGTCTTTNVNVSGSTVNTAIYGGGNLVDTTTTNVTISNIANSVPYVFGGGKSAGAVTTNVSLIDNGSGDITVTNVHGGSDTSGDVTTSNVTINKGTITNVYGGNRSGGSTETSNVTVNNGNITNTYGGGYSASGDDTTVTINGGILSTIYGGGEGSAAVITNDTNVIINGATITSAVYGGGNAGSVNGNTNITVNNSESTIPNIYGGGNKAGAQNTNILLNALDSGSNNINVTNIFGGSNQSGAVGVSTIVVDKGIVNSIYGGNNAGGTTTYTNIDINAGTISNIYGGGNQAVVTNNTNVNIDGGTITTLYGGGNQAEVSNSTNATINSGLVRNVYGGGNSAGTPTSNVIINVTNNNTITNVYGGSKSSGTVTTSNIDILNGNITNLYGGNDQGGVTTNANINFTNGNAAYIYGGGNMAETGATNVKVLGGTSGTIYGGGNMAKVSGNTSVIINDATITNSAYAGGNGSSATVEGNTSIIVGGTTTVGTPSCTVLSTCSVFGGGNAAVTGVEANNNSVASVKILGATIYGNVYGGANTSKVFGATNVNIGRDNTETSEVSFGNVSIHGTVFGGGEANASGSEEYDWSFVSVTNAINVNINGANYNNFEILGSVFGSGNASTTTGTSEIMIKNYGTFTNPKRNVSIQRTDKLTIDNSSIVLRGATDRENEYSDVLFTLSRIDELDLINNSTLYLESGANLLQEFKSLTSDLSLATVTINENNGTVNKNVDNRVYMLIGEKLNIAKDQSITDYGEVSGMSFFGMYKYDGAGNIDRGIYDDFDYGDTLSWGDVFDNVSSYVLGLHKTNHDIEVDGFYTNYMDEATGTNVVDYIIPTPPNGDLYMWVIGESVIEYEIDLVASKYSTLGTYELSLIDFTDPNTSFTILGLDDSEINPDISLVSKSMIPKIAATDEAADETMGLSMESSNSGWLSNGFTEFLTGVDEPISGTETYVGGNSGTTPTLQFSLRHSKNIATDGDMGNVKIQLLAVTQIDALTKETKRLVIIVNMNRVLYDTVNYEAAITAGRKYDLFATTATNITSRSSISTFFSLFNDGESIYRNGYYRTLVSNYVLPLNTKMTMIDLSQDNPQYYYQIIDESDVTRGVNELQSYGEVTYRLSDFEKMGTKDTSVYYSDSEKNNEYYNSTLEYTNEEFIFIIDFNDTEINENHLNNSLLLEIRNEDSEIIYSVLAHQHSYMNYSIYANSDAVIDVDGSISTNKIYNGESLIVDLLATYTQTKVGSTTIYDTHYFDSKLGIKISLINSEGVVVTGTTLLGLSYTIDDLAYHPSIDGTTRIKIADKVDSAEKWIILDTGTSTIASGNYILRIESFGSSDGIYYGLTSSDYIDFNIEIVNEIYGLEAETTYEEMVIGTDGLNENDTNTLVYNFSYNSGLQNPNIRVKLYRRKYDTIYSTEYELVDARNYFTNDLTATNTNEYLLISDPSSTTNYTFTWKDNLLTGTYKIEFILYDDNSSIGSIEKYVIIK